jgi:hypothetical protein
LPNPRARLVLRPTAWQAAAAVLVLLALCLEPALVLAASAGAMPAGTLALRRAGDDPAVERRAPAQPATWRQASSWRVADAAPTGGRLQLRAPAFCRLPSLRPEGGWTPTGPPGPAPGCAPMA